MFCFDITDRKSFTNTALWIVCCVLCCFAVVCCYRVLLCRCSVSVLLFCVVVCFEHCGVVRCSVLLCLLLVCVVRLCAVCVVVVGLLVLWCCVLVMCFVGDVFLCVV